MDYTPQVILKSLIDRGLVSWEDSFVNGFFNLTDTQCENLIWRLLKDRKLDHEVFLKTICDNSGFEWCMKWEIITHFNANHYLKYEVAQRLQIIPINIENNILSVLKWNPWNDEDIGLLSVLGGFRGGIKIILTAREEFNRVFDICYADYKAFNARLINNGVNYEARLTRSNGSFL